MDRYAGIWGRLRRRERRGGGKTMKTEAKINRFIEMLERNKRYRLSFIKLITELEDEGYNLVEYMQLRENWKKRKYNRKEKI